MAKVYCVCQRPANPKKKNMIQCDKCSEWYHYSCVGVSQQEVEMLTKYFCPDCVDTVKRKYRATEAEDDLTEPQEIGFSGKMASLIQLMRETVTREPNDEELMIYKDGYEAQMDKIGSIGFEKPFVVNSLDGVDMKFPVEKVNLEFIRQNLDLTKTVPVIDVEKQTELENWTLADWFKYFEYNCMRNRVLNVLSLEFSDSSLAKYIGAPKAVTGLDLTYIFPESVPSNKKPCVKLYCLMSAKDSFTDFHIDFGGSSVFYHIIHGCKIFYLAPPTPANLSVYEEWIAATIREPLVHKLEGCSKIVLVAGQIFFIPSGWIHAVYTPQDSLVIGGNFLQMRSIEMQIKVAGIEDRTNTPERFKFPFFNATMWLIANSIIDGKIKFPNVSERRSKIKALKKYLNTTDYNEDEITKLIRRSTESLLKELQ